MYRSKLFMVCCMVLIKNNANIPVSVCFLTFCHHGLSSHNYIAVVMPIAMGAIAIIAMVTMI